jgi:predicted glycosyltransferase
LFGVAIEAKRIWKQDIGSWTLVAGPLYGDAALERLRNQGPKGIEILGASSALPSLYRSAALVVSQGGYNTVCEALSQGAKLTVVPYATEKETEQSLRAERFAALGLLTSIEEEKLNATSLVDSMERALLRPPSDTRIDFGGAARTTQILRQLVMERRT